MDVQDLLSGVEHVIAIGVADPERLGVLGWSYGGFLTASLIAQTPPGGRPRFRRRQGWPQSSLPVWTVVDRFQPNLHR